MMMRPAPCVAYAPRAMTGSHVSRLLRSPYQREFARALWGSRRGGRLRIKPPIQLDAHLAATYRWLCAAQDAAGGGVAGFFDMVSGTWSAAYPETTGYIIPTFLAFAEATGDSEARARALRMADWEVEVQMDDGAVLSGLVGMPEGPAVFNTGQAIFGWVSAFQATEDERYRKAAIGAADWLSRHQDEDGAWRRRLSMMTSGSAPSYNVRCAWALAYAASVLEEESYLKVARANCDWVLRQRNRAGWFAHAGFTDQEVPLLHTVSYVVEGLLGVHMFGGDGPYLEAATRASDAMVTRWRAGTLGGRLDGDWRSPVSWRCPTGDAQLAVVLQRLERLLPGNGYGQVAQELTIDLAEMQVELAGRGAFSAPPTAHSAAVLGGVPGSFPVWGEYMRFGLPNWAAKFYLDALLLAVHGVDEMSARVPAGAPSGSAGG